MINSRPLTPALSRRERESLRRGVDGLNVVCAIPRFMPSVYGNSEERRTVTLSRRERAGVRGREFCISLPGSILTGQRQTAVEAAEAAVWVDSQTLSRRDCVA
jgi:hypothetical protein